MICLNIQCCMNSSEAENSCEHIKDPNYLTCRQYYGLGLGDATVTSAVGAITTKASVKYLERLKYRLENPLLELTHIDTQMLAQLIPSVATIASFLKGD